MISLEVCADSLTSIYAAEAGGANRIELCANLYEGGTTPCLAQIKQAKAKTKLKLNVIIRPRGGDFLYNNDEFELMKNDIATCGEIGCNGVVIGMLNADGTIDKERCAELIKIARTYGMEVTFHRAFDRSSDLFKALEDVIELGCERILTSGGEDTAPKGAPTIKKLVEQANERIIIMPGAGITESNIGELVRQTGLKEFHGTFRSSYPSKMKYINSLFVKEYNYLYTDENKVKEAIKNANSNA